ANEAEDSDAEAFVALLELRDAAATIDKRLRAAGPCRVGGRVDVEVHDVAFLAPGGAGDVFGAIGHDDLDGVVIGMDIGFHRCRPGLWAVARRYAAAMRPLSKPEAAAKESHGFKNGRLAYTGAGTDSQG